MKKLLMCFIVIFILGIILAILSPLFANSAVDNYKNGNTVIKQDGSYSETTLIFTEPEIIGLRQIYFYSYITVSIAFIALGIVGIKYCMKNINKSYRS
jgi:uncharacterized protein YxeA